MLIEGNKKSTTTHKKYNFNAVDPDAINKPPKKRKVIKKSDKLYLMADTINGIVEVSQKDYLDSEDYQVVSNAEFYTALTEDCMVRTRVDGQNKEAFILLLDTEYGIDYLRDKDVI